MCKSRSRGVRESTFSRTKKEDGWLFTAMLLYACEASDATVNAVAWGNERYLLPVFTEEFDRMEDEKC